MDPIENCNPGCIPVSSTCVIWQGPNLPCISLNTGDSINIVIFELATKLCEMTDGNIDVSSLDFKCVLENLEDDPVMLTTALQAVIDKVCTLQDIVDDIVIPATPGTADPITLPACLQYTVEGELVTSLLSDAYSFKLASEICNILSDINTLNSQFSNLNDRVLLLESYVDENPTGTSTLPTVIIPCLNDGVSEMSLVNAITTIDTAICAMKDALGSNTSLVDSVSKECTGLANAAQLSAPLLQMNDITGWVDSPSTIANTINNLWLTICDMRSAMESVISLTTPTCSNVIMDFGVTLNAERTQATITLFDYATIPAGFTNVSTSKITVGDGTRTYDQVVDVVLMAASSGEDVVIDLAANNISSVSGLTFTLTGNLLTTLGDPCSKTKVNTAPFVCPATAPESVVVTIDGLNAQFTTVMPIGLPIPVVNYTYTVKKLNGVIAYGPATINDTVLNIGGLLNGTSYNVEVKANYACGSSVPVIELFTTEACDSRPTSISFTNSSSVPGGSLTVGSLSVPVSTTASVNTNCDGTLSLIYETSASMAVQGVLTINGVVVDTITASTGIKTQVYSIPTVLSGSVIIGFVISDVSAPPPPNVGPSANAGINQSITLPTSSLTLTGSGNDPDGTITAYAWTKISGPAGGTITSPSSSSTDVTGFTTAGTYVYRLTVTDNEGATATDDIQITVNSEIVPPNEAPTANAGTDIAITLPTSTTTLTGTGNDTDGTISTYAWTKLSGPAGGTIVSASSASTSITDLSTAGTYVYQLTVTDNDGATGTDTIQIVVSEAAVGYDYYLANQYECLSSTTVATNLVVAFTAGTPLFLGKFYLESSAAVYSYELVGSTLSTTPSVVLEGSIYYLTGEDACAGTGGTSNAL